MEHSFVQTAKLQMDNPVLTVFGQCPPGQNQHRCLSSFKRAGFLDFLRLISKLPRFVVDLTQNAAPCGCVCHPVL